jgi:hypothetical protein
MMTSSQVQAKGCAVNQEPVEDDGELAGERRHDRCSRFVERPDSEAFREEAPCFLVSRMLAPSYRAVHTVASPGLVIRLFQPVTPAWQLWDTRRVRPATAAL